MNLPAGELAKLKKWAKIQFPQDEQAAGIALAAAKSAIQAGYSYDEALTAARDAAAKPAAPDCPVSDANTLRGQVSSFRTRTEQMGTGWATVWDFRVDQWDSAGQPINPVSVEMRGMTFAGSLGDGDWVEIPGRFAPGEIFRVNWLRNLTMNAPVAADNAPAPVPPPAEDMGTTQPPRWPVGRIIILVLILIVLYVLARILGF